VPGAWSACSPHSPNKKLIPACQTGLILRASRLIRGRCHEASCWRSGERRLRFCLASSIPGRPGSPSDLTTGVCPQGLDEGRMNGGESLRDQGERMLPVRPRKHGPGVEEAAAVKRRKARRPALSAGVSAAAETGPAARRATGAAFAPAPFGASPPRIFGDGETSAEAGEGKTGEPRAGQTTGAAERWLRRLFEN
jgi:hypothetical protein